MNTIISPAELASELQSGADLLLLDVREPHELQISVLPGVVAIPLGSLPGHVSQLSKDANIVVICRTGNRSHQATEYLLQLGFTQVRNLVGGMNRWATEVDPSMPTY